MEKEEKFVFHLTLQEVESGNGHEIRYLSSEFEEINVTDLELFDIKDQTEEQKIALEEIGPRVSLRLDLELHVKQDKFHPVYVKHFCTAVVARTEVGGWSNNFKRINEWIQEYFFQKKIWIRIPWNPDISLDVEDREVMKDAYPDITVMKKLN
jgi:hypothetical protein